MFLDCMISSIMSSSFLWVRFLFQLSSCALSHPGWPVDVPYRFATVVSLSKMCNMINAFKILCVA